MNRNRKSFVFDEDAWIELHDLRELVAQILVEGGNAAALYFRAGLEANFRTVSADRGKSQRIEDAVDLRNRTPTDERDRATET